ncbi:ZIP zinc transporter-domain-containing protein [Pilobolus umbonatus]|nr:ZIP zinc transporter-domain-containing protein [Pilobolus umbonatus]
MLQNLSSTKDSEDNLIGLERKIDIKLERETRQCLLQSATRWSENVESIQNESLTNASPRIQYDRSMLLTLAGSQFVKIQPNDMTFIPGVTRTPNQCEVVTSLHKSKDRKKKTEKVKKTYECAAQPIENYDMGLRVGSIFIILGTSALGTYMPILLHYIKPYQQGDIQDWLLTIGKFFGTGVILATAFVHMLPSAYENFKSPCLTQGWLDYGAFAGVFCMIASFALQLLEVASVSYISKRRRRLQDIDSPSSSQNPVDPRSNNKHDHPLSSDNTTIQICSVNAHHSRELTHNAFIEVEDSFRHIGTYILELGIVMHSVIIGIALANIENAEFISLLIALVFHQFFEGMALGTRLNELHYSTWIKACLMGLLYIIMTPLGIAIGIGIRTSFNPKSYSAVLSQAILDSLSAGILLYNAYVSLMSIEMSHNQAFYESSTTRKVASFISMYIGAAVMALIGKWA